MGQKVHPGGMRLGIIHDWKAHWYTERHFAGFLHEDLAHPRAHPEEDGPRRASPPS